MTTRMKMKLLTLNSAKPKPLSSLMDLGQLHTLKSLLSIYLPSLPLYPQTHLLNIWYHFLPTRLLNPNLHRQMLPSHKTTKNLSPSATLWCRTSSLFKHKLCHLLWRTRTKELQDMYGPWLANLLSPSCEHYSIFNIQWAKKSSHKRSNFTCQANYCSNSKGKPMGN